MKTKTLLILFVTICVVSVIAQTSTYTAAEAAKHVGETATVTDRVDGVHQSGKGNIFLNMGGKYPNQAFTAFIPSSSAAQFSQPEQYEGRTVAVSGKITLYHGKPEKSGKRLNSYTVTVKALLGARCNLTDDGCRIANLWRVIAGVLKNLQVPIMKDWTGAICCFGWACVR